MGGRSPQRMGACHQWQHKSQVSLWGLPCVHGVAGSLHEEVRDMLGEIHNFKFGLIKLHMFPTYQNIKAPNTRNQCLIKYTLTLVAWLL